MNTTLIQEMNAKSKNVLNATTLEECDAIMLKWWRSLSKNEQNQLSRELLYPKASKAAGLREVLARARDRRSSWLRCSVINP